MLTIDIGIVKANMPGPLRIDTTPIAAIISMGGRRTDIQDTEGFEPIDGGDSTSISDVPVAGLSRGERWKNG
jgi:hypothetical protein